MDAFAVKVGGQLKIDTTYEHESLSKMHWLAYNSGDYDLDDFLMLPDRLKPGEEFEKYPEAQIVRVKLCEVDQ